MANFGETLVSWIVDDGNTQQSKSTPLPADTGQSMSLEPPNKRLKIETSLTPAGARNFLELVSKGDYVVDKSLLVDDFMNSKRTVLVFHYPPRWGKSINLDLVGLFIEIPVDSNGDSIENVTQCDAYKLFVEGRTPNGRILRPHLSVSKKLALINSHLGRWPVIRIDFGESADIDYNAVLNGVKAALSIAYEQHSYLLDKMEEIAENAEAKWKRRESSMMKSKVVRFNNLLLHEGADATEVQVHDAIGFLAEQLKRHYGKKAIVLIDNYDAPINYVMQKGSQRSIDQTIVLFSKLYGLMGKSDHVERAMAMGTFRYAKTSFFTSSEDVGEYNFINHELAPRFGIYRNELVKIFDHLGVEMMQVAKDQYGGYTTLVSNAELQCYHPNSIRAFINSDYNAKVYASTHHSMKMVEEMFSYPAIRTQLEKLIAGEAIPVAFNGQLEISEKAFARLRAASTQIADDVEEAIIDDLLKLLYHSGFLTVREVEGRQTVVVPNEEMRKILFAKTLDGFVHRYTISLPALAAATDKFTEMVGDTDNEDVSDFMDAYRATLINVRPVSLHVVGDADNTPGVEVNEDVVHSIVNMIALNAKTIKFGPELIFYTPKKVKPDVTVIHMRRRMATIIEMKRAASLEKTTAADQLNDYKEIFAQRSTIARVKLIALNVRRNETSTDGNKWELDYTCKIHVYG